MSSSKIADENKISKEHEWCTYTHDWNTKIGKLLIRETYLTPDSNKIICKLKYREINNNCDEF